MVLLIHITLFDERLTLMGFVEVSYNLGVALWPLLETQHNSLSILWDSGLMAPT